MKIKIGRVELVFAGLLAVYLVLSYLLPRTIWLVLLKDVVVILGAWVAIRISRKLVRTSIWRLRNRLVVAYFFIAVVPIILITTLLGLGAYLVAGQLSTYLVTSELDRKIESLRATAGFLTRDDVHRDAWSQGIAPFLQARYPGLIIVAEGPSPWKFPPDANVTTPAAGWPESSGLVLKDKFLYGWAHIRQDNNRVTMLFPMTREYLGDLTPDLANIDIVDLNDTDSGSHLHPSVQHQASKNRMPPAVNFLDVAVFSTIPILVASWDSPGKTVTQYVAVFTRPSALLRKVYGQRSGFADELIPLLFYSVAILFLIAELLALKVGITITTTITGAVNDLYEGTQKVTKGDFSHRIPAPRSDQLGGLAVSFNQMTGNLQRLVEVEKERERLQGEIQIAREVQTQLYPKVVPNLKSLALVALCDPARLVSGDYYDYQQLLNTKIAVAMGDVCGKGISAALLMATIQSSFRMQLRTSLELAKAVGHEQVISSISTSTLVSHLNKQLFAHTAAEKFATFFLGVYDEPSSTLTYTNAGHLPPILVREGTASRLEVNGLVVGAFDFAKYEESRLRLYAGDLLVFFTDGITEPENEYGEMFGEDRLTELVVKNAHLADEPLAQMIVDAAKNWTSSAELQDDMTVLLMRRR
jgi:sigma-B regulation protein RsbU (phosphoserine phosphatase)